jgi:hypothetical protein
LNTSVATQFTGELATRKLATTMYPAPGAFGTATLSPARKLTDDNTEGTPQRDALERSNTCHLADVTDGEKSHTNARIYSGDSHIGFRPSMAYNGARNTASGPPSATNAFALIASNAGVYALYD